MDTHCNTVDIQTLKQLNDLTRLTYYRKGVSFLFLEKGAAYTPGEILQAARATDIKVLSKCWIAHISNHSFDLYPFNGWLKGQQRPCKQNDSAMRWIEAQGEQPEGLLVLDLRPEFLNPQNYAGGYIPAGLIIIKYAYHVHKLSLLRSQAKIIRPVFLNDLIPQTPIMARVQ